MEEAEKELERRSKFLSNLIQKKKASDQQNLHPHHHEITIRVKDSDVLKKKASDEHHHHEITIRVKASDMSMVLQKKAFKCATDHLYSMSTGNVNGLKIDTKSLALALKKEFDTSYGPAWHCIVGTSFGSYVTHSLGGFLYFSINKVCVLLFKTVVEPLER